MAHVSTHHPFDPVEAILIATLIRFHLTPRTPEKTFAKQFHTCYDAPSMIQNNARTTRLSRGAVSTGTILTVVAIAFGLYIAFKLNALEGRVQSVETKVAAGPQAPEPEKPLEKDVVKALFKKGNIVFGKADAKLLIVEFSDPSCPFCNVAAGMSSEIAESMDPQGKRFVSKENGGTYEPPMPEIKKLVDAGKASFVQLYANGHGNGELASQALYCAHESDTFWETHDALYTKEGYDLINNDVKNDTTKAGALAAYLADVTDAGKMEQCLSSGKYAKKITEDMATAQALGFSGTPMFIINTQKFPGAYSYADMKSAIDAALK